MAMAFLCVFSWSRRWPVTFDAFLLVLYWCTNDFLLFSQLHTDPHEHFNSYAPRWLFGIKLSLFLHKIFFKLGPAWNATLNPNFCISFLIFGPNFGTQGKVIVCFLLVLLLLLLLLLVLHVFFSELLIIFCNVFPSWPFSQNISVRHSISALRYFSEQILVALTKNPLNMRIIVSSHEYHQHITYTFLEPDLRSMLLQWLCLPNSECNFRIKQP